MGVYVKGMKMPKSCSDCLFFVDGLYDANDEPCSACLAKVDNAPSGCGYKEIDGIDHATGRMHYCPLVEVPEPHGDLIDRDEARNDVFHHLSIKGEENLLPSEKSIFWNLIKAKAVIEAEGER